MHASDTKAGGRQQGAFSPIDVGMMASRRDDRGARLLAIGVVCNENNYNQRQRVRSLYSRFSSLVAVRFILDDAFLRRQGAFVGDEVGVVVRSPPSHAHCVDKAFGWWRVALRTVRARFYAKTDDDTALSLAHLLPIVRLMPRSGAYGGAVRYTSMSLANRSAACFAWGCRTALSLKRRACPSLFGPFPFVSGPLQVLSADVVAWVAPRLDRHEAQHCQFEDRLLGLALTSHPSLTMVNLAHTTGRMNVVNNQGEWLGAESFAAHWVKRHDLFARVLEDHSAMEPPAVAARRFCATARARLSRGGSGATAAAAAARFCADAPGAWRLQLACAPWRQEYDELSQYPCCHEWASCTGPPRGAVVHWRKNRSRLRWQAWRRAAGAGGTTVSGQGRAPAASLHVRPAGSRAGERTRPSTGRLGLRDRDAA